MTSSLTLILFFVPGMLPFPHLVPLPTIRFVDTSIFSSQVNSHTGCKGLKKGAVRHKLLKKEKGGYVGCADNKGFLR